MSNTQEQIAVLKERKRLYEIKVYDFFKGKIGRSVEQNEKRFIKKNFVEENYVQNQAIEGKIYIRPSLKSGRLYQPKIPKSLQPFFKITRWNIYLEPLEYSLKINQ